MDHIDALNDLKRLKRKCKEFCSELDDFKRLLNDKDGINSSYQEFLQFILDNAEMDGDDKKKREDTTYIDDEDEYDEEDDPKYEQRNDSQNTLEHEGHRDHEDQPDKRNKILQIQIKVEGQKAGTSNFVSEKLRNPAQQSVKSKNQTQRKLPEAFLLDDDNEDNSQLGPCCNQVDLPGPREPSKGSHRSVCLLLLVSSLVLFDLSNIGFNCYLCCMIYRRLVVIQCQKSCMRKPRDTNKGNLRK